MTGTEGVQIAAERMQEVIAGAQVVVGLKDDLNAAADRLERAAKEAAREALLTYASELDDYTEALLAVPGEGFWGWFATKITGPTVRQVLGDASRRAREKAEAQP